MTYSVWKHFGASILAHPEVTLAAYLGAPSAVADAKASRIPVPNASSFFKDSSFDVNPHRLDLPADYLQSMFLIRTLAAWGPRPLVHAAVVASDIQLAGRPGAKTKLQRSVVTAAEAARRFLERPSARSRSAARKAAAACREHYAPFEDDPDSPEGRERWLALGSSWFAAETAAQDFSLGEWDGRGPAQASPSWGNRIVVWPQRAVEAASELTSYALVRERITEALGRPRA